MRINVGDLVISKRNTSIWRVARGDPDNALLGYLAPAGAVCLVQELHGCLTHLGSQGSVIGKNDEEPNDNSKVMVMMTICSKTVIGWCVSSDLRKVE